MAFLTTVKAKLWILIALFTLTIMLFAAYAYSVLNAVKVGGPLYGQITQTMNIRADILPPPQYLLETELTAFQMADEASANAPDDVLKKYETKLKQLQKDFDDGQQSWNTQLPSDTLRARSIRVLLLEKNADSAQEYFKTLFGEFLPAVYARNKTEVNKLLHGTMKQQADKHRAIIDQLTALTDESSRADEAYAGRFVRQRVLFATCFIAGMLVLCVFTAVRIIKSITQPVAEAIRVIRELDSGNLNARVQEYADDELGHMCESLNHAISSVRSTIGSTVQSCMNLAKFSNSLSAVASSVSSGVHRQAANLTETSAQLGEVASLGQTIASGGREGQEAAERSRDAAQTGVHVVEAAIEGMLTISKAAAEVTQIVDAVDEISFNTNLLAVNASVEAAVAGEQGRGFKVVAEEIRSLSLRTAAAGKKIRKLIQDTQEAIAQGTERVQASGASFDEINRCVQRLKSIMDEIASSSSVQADSLRQLNDTVSAIAEVVDQNSIGTESINTTSRELAKEAQTMHNLVHGFQIG